MRSSLPQPHFYRKAESVTHASNALTAWWECRNTFESTTHSLPAPPCSISPFFSPPCAQPVFQALLFALCLWHNPVLRNHLCTTQSSTYVRRVFMQAHVLASPLLGPFKFLLWQTDLLKGVIHTARSRIRPTSLRYRHRQVCGFAKSYSAAGSGPPPRVDFPFWPSRFTWLAFGLSFWMCFKMGAHLNIAKYDASLARNMARTCSLTSLCYFGLQIWLAA